MILLLLLLVFWGGSLAAEPAEKMADSDQYVLIISIDGFPADALWDKKVPIPAIRSLAREGAWARGMRPSNPSLTWPNHTTLVTGVDSHKHHILYNGKLERTNGRLPVRVNPRKDKQELTRSETLFDLAFQSGLTTAEVNWPVTRNAGTLHDSFPDTPDNVGNMTDDLRWEIFDEGILDDMTTFALWQHSSPGRDAVWTRTAIHLIENRMPNLLLLHLLHVDSTHHRIGVHTKPGYTAMAFADYQVRDILDALDRTGVREQTSIFIVSDHGFTNTPQTILPNLILAEAGLLELSEDDQILSGKAQAVANGGFAMIYLDDPEDAETLQKVKSLFEGQEGIYKVLAPDEYSGYGLPHPEESDQSGDLAIFSYPGFGMSNSLQGDEPLVNSSDFGFSAGHHGFSSDFAQMNTLFVASGRGIRQGVQLGEIDNRSVAPTAAYLLGLDLEEADGEILNDILMLMSVLE
jgi:predicted AlkP superfamily pyrophosphatase or phosphodiesterase